MAFPLGAEDDARYGCDGCFFEERLHRLPRVAAQAGANVWKDIEGAWRRKTSESGVVKAAHEEVAPLTVLFAQRRKVVPGVTDGGRRGELRRRRNAVDRVQHELPDEIHD